MADESAVWQHIGDLHKKHSELAIQMHERGGNDELLSAVQELTGVIKQLIVAVKEDVKADLGKKVPRETNKT